MLSKRYWLALMSAAIVALSATTTLIVADDNETCSDDKASDSARLAACSNVIRRYRPSSSGSAQAAIDFNNAMIAYLTRIELYDRRGKTDLAIADADTAIRIGHADPIVGYFYFTRTELYLKKKDAMKAIALLTSAIERKVKYPPADSLFSNRAYVRWSMKDMERAIADINEAIRLDPNDIEHYQRRSGYYFAKGDFTRALQDLDAAVRRQPSKAAPLVWRAGLHADRGDLDNAFADLTEAIRVEPESGYPWGNRALRWRDLGEHDKALADYDEALKRFPKNGVIWASRGEVWRLKGDLDRALLDQNKGLDLYPRNAVVLLLRADTLRYRGEYDKALADYDRASKEGAAYALPVATGRGLVYERLRDFGRAREEFAKAVTLGKGVVLVDIFKSGYATAVARLAALDSGVEPPVIQPYPKNVKTPTAVPTEEVAVPPPPPAAAGQPDQGRRVALVIGNSAYQKVPRLENPERDAKALAAAFRNLGFAAVSVATDATREKLIEVLRSFADEAEKADWAVVYYAGHGVEIGGTNYLLPVDAKIASDRDVQFEAVPLDQVMAAVEPARKLRLMILDACRDNPFVSHMRRTPAPAAAPLPAAGPGAKGTRSVGRGLGAVNVTGATLVVYAAKHGQVALDGEGGNSPFAAALLQRIATPGVEIDKLFRLVRDDVMEATAGRQEPYTYGSLPGRVDFYFVGKAPGAAAPRSIAPVAAIPGVTPPRGVVAVPPTSPSPGPDKKAAALETATRWLAKIERQAPHRLLAPSCGECIPFVIQCTTPLSSVSDLKGKRVALRSKRLEPRYDELQRVVQDNGGSIQSIPEFVLADAFTSRLVDCTLTGGGPIE